jgi:hypothetical protein
MFRRNNAVNHVLIAIAAPLAIGVAGCGANGGSGSGTSDQTGDNLPPSGTQQQPPTVGGNQQQPPTIGGSTGTGTTTPPTSTGTPPTTTGTPPTSTGTPPTTTGTPPTSTGTPPTTTGTPPTTTGTPPASTGTTPSGFLPVNYDANGILLAPDPSLGVQIETPTFTLNPGDEVFKCYHTSVPNSSESDVHRFVSQMTPGSHHFILYQANSASEPDGTLDATGCTGGLDSTWVYASSSVDNQLPMPDGVAMPFAAKQPILFDMHYINTGTDSLQVHILLNLEFAQGTFQKAGSLVSFNTSINVPPNGTQTVSGTCTVPQGAQFFVASTHTHKHATLATIHRYTNGAIGDELVHTTDWEHPDVGTWETPPYLTFGANEKIYYACTYQNDTAQAITVGISAIKNEMCMAVMYFFPAPNGGVGCSAF